MINNYLKIAWRNLIRNKAFSIINISGLALGMACSLLIVLWVQDERSVDNFHANGKQLYQVYERNRYEGKVEAEYGTQGLLAAELKRNVPGIKYAVSLEQSMPRTFETGGRISRMHGSYTSTDFFTMFSFPLLQGTPQTALNMPGGIAVSRNMATLFFGSPAAAMGKTLRYENRENLMVTAVFDNMPANSSLQFDFLCNWDDYTKANQWVSNWRSAGPATYVQLETGVTADKISAGIKDFIYRYQQKSAEVTTELGLQPFEEKYLHATFRNGQPDGGRVEYVRLFSFIALFILLIACINFMNLATARSAKRAKEVGVRKVLGAFRSVLVAQFIGEALLLAVFAGIIAIGLVALLLPVFNTLTGKLLYLPIAQPMFWLSFLGLLLFTGLIAGSYPALFLSSLLPVKVLKATLSFSRGATFFRKGLVVFQFSLSMILIVGMIVIYHQMDYIQSKNLGYDRDNLIYIPLEGDLVKNYELFKEEAGKVRGVAGISRMRQSPTSFDHYNNDVGWEGKNPAVAGYFADAVVGYDFVKTMHLQLKAGRDFSRNFATDSTNYLVNETALKIIGYADPIGRPLWRGDAKGQIIGVLKDFHFKSMHEAIEPLFIRLGANTIGGTILVRTAGGNTKVILSELEKIATTLNPKFPFTFQFSDQEYTRLYKNEQIITQLATYFAFLAIFISCLGLFGLATFTAEQRTREIGIRKVLGASVTGIVTLLSKDFLKLVIIAIILATPVAWYAMHLWLQGFVYKVDMAWWMFVLAGVMAIFIAMLTVAFQSVKAGLLDPARSLKTE